MVHVALCEVLVVLNVPFRVVFGHQNEKISDHFGVNVLIQLPNSIAGDRVDFIEISVFVGLGEAA